MKYWIDTAKQWARTIMRDVLALWIAGRDRRTPTGAKVIAAVMAAYALSPVDLIPDFIPVLGYLDDLIIVPLGIMLAVRLIPVPLMAEFRALAKEREECPASKIAVFAIVVLWVAGAALIGWWIWGKLSH